MQRSAHSNILTCDMVLFGVRVIANQPIKSWSSEVVLHWLKINSLALPIQAALSKPDGARLTGAELQALTHDDLMRRWSVGSKLQRLKLLSAIRSVAASGDKSKAKSQRDSK